MLKQRIITALILLVVLLPTLWLRSPEPFMVLALLGVGAAAWEWGRLCGANGAGAWVTGLGCALLCVLMWLAGWPWAPSARLWSVVALAWLVGGAALLVLGVAGWPRLPRALRWVGGVAALAAAWLALAQARVLGTNFLLSVLLLVWAADVFAYFAGRALGGRIVPRKLAPSISPGKSWEGVAGGVLGVALVAAAWIAADAQAQASVPSLYSRLLAHGGVVLALALLGLTAMSVVGDLCESLVKRSAGVKDSSQLLPGHGGVLDRVDALLPTVPMALWLISALG